jgi:polysaccharide biosynthesis/export protein
MKADFDRISFLYLFLVTVAFLLFAPPAAQAEYVVAAGDTLEVSVSGFPDLRQRLSIDVDGDIVLTLAGSVHVAGLPLSEVTEKIKNAYANLPIRIRAPDGRINVMQAYPEEVTVRMSEYRPIYIAGDVSNPGALTYTPHMTVERAIALAGGLERIRAKSKDLVLERIDLEGERELLLAEEKISTENVNYLKLLLNDSLDPKQTSAVELSGDANLSAVEKAVRLRMLEGHKHYQNEVRSVEGLIDRAKSQTKSIEQQYLRLKELCDSQTALVAKISNSALPPLQVLQQQRDLGMTLERLGQLETQLAEAKKAEETLIRQLSRTKEERKNTLLTELQDSLSKLRSVASRQSTIEDKLNYLGGASGTNTRASDTDVETVIQRDISNQRVDAAYKTELSPGDILHVTVITPKSPRLSSILERHMLQNKRFLSESEDQWHENKPE